MANAKDDELGGPQRRDPDKTDHATVVEIVFSWPGLGLLAYEAANARDFPIVQACCLIFAATFILLNLAADVGAILTNPRLRHPK